MAAGGYVWWYLDAVSDDGRHALTVIAFIGSVFSPYYAAARRRAGPLAAEPDRHIALNIALYDLQGGGHRWAMTERGQADLARSATQLRIGPSALTWRAGALELQIDEVTVPWPSRLRGRLRLWPQSLFERQQPLDAAGRHRWTPIAPRARIEVAMAQPGLAWQGQAYLDSNRGDQPLEQAFSHWQWSRTATPDGGCQVVYDVQPRSGAALALVLAVDAQGQSRLLPVPPATDLPSSRWGLARSTRCAPGHHIALHRTLEDGPFYARSLLRSQGPDGPQAVVHESLSLQRFEQRWVQALLPFRMPRHARRAA